MDYCAGDPGSILAGAEFPTGIQFWVIREIKTNVKKQQDLYVNNLVGDIKANPRDFYRYINGQKKDSQGVPSLNRKNGNGVAESGLEQADEFTYWSVYGCVQQNMSTAKSRSHFINDIFVSA